VRWIRRRPASSARAIAVVELPKSKPGTRRPWTSPMMRASGHRSRRVNASSTPPTSTTSDAPRSNAYAAVLKARKTSMTTVSPRAFLAPSSRRRRWSVGMHQEERIGAEPLADGLHRDDVARRHVAEVHVGTEVLHQPDLLVLLRRLEHHARRIDLGLDLLDEAGLHFAGALVDADGAGFSALADDLPRAGGELFLDVLHPAGGRDDARAVLAADLGEDGEVPREALDVLELLRARDVDHAVRHLDVLEAVVLQEGDVLGDLLLHDGELEETATAADVDVVAAV